MRLGGDPDFQAIVQICDRYEAIALWEEAAPFLQASVDRGIGDLTLEDLRDGVSRGAAALLIFTGRYADVVGAAVTELLKHPDQRKVLKILAYGGVAFETMRHCLAQVEEDAKKKGAQAVLFHGRPGWQKVCGPMGYEVKQIIMEKAL
jgi:hypothetical protein